MTEIYYRYSVSVFSCFVIWPERTVPLKRPPASQELLAMCKMNNSLYCIAVFLSKIYCNFIVLFYSYFMVKTSIFQYKKIMKFLWLLLFLIGSSKQNRCSHQKLLSDDHSGLFAAFLRYCFCYFTLVRFIRFR